MEAYSEKTNTHYPSWDALIEEEANGYVVVAVISNGKKTWPWVIGPFNVRENAQRAQARLRYKLKKDLKTRPGFTGKVFVRPAWKDGQ